MTKVKICGITNLEDALLAAEAGADLLGFIFYPPSPRAVEVDGVRPIVQALQTEHAGVGLVGVFVDEPVERVAAIVRACGLDHAQLHGSEPPRDVDELVSQGIAVIKGFRLRDGSAMQEMACYQPTAFLLDTYVAGRPGGTGETFDWRLARDAPPGARVVLAGGLTPDNVVEAMRTARAWGVDVSSGVEARPGRKDHDKVRRFIAAAKQAGEEGSPG